MKTLRAIVNDKKLRLKCLAVIGILLGIRALSNIPTPGVDSGYFASVVDENAALGLFNVMTGGGLTSLSVMALGITPYITATIVLQLLGVMMPKLRDIQRSPAKTDRDRLKKITFLSGGALALIEALGMAVGFGGSGMLVNYTWYNVTLITAVWTAGALFLIFLGELITDRLIGNGISLILAANIIVSFPSDLKSVWDVIIHNGDMSAQISKGVIVAAFLFAMIAFIVVLNQTTRNIPVTVSGKLKAGGAAGAQSYDIPLKLCPGSVIPVVFASSVLSLPLLVLTFTGRSGNNFFFRMFDSSNWFSAARPWCSLGVVLYVAMIFGFSYFYSEIAMSPDEVADNLKKAGSAVPGIRAGRPTAEYLRKQMNAVNFIGSAALSVAAVVPYIIGGIFTLSSLSILGTSLIIVVGVIVETKATLDGETRNSFYRERKGGIFHA